MRCVPILHADVATAQSHITYEISVMMVATDDLFGWTPYVSLSSWFEYCLNHNFYVLDYHAWKTLIWELFALELWVRTS